ncbi:hypothetical protein KC928_13165 [Enterobacter cloacae]|uniref:hypothetical protein n=1 Tax=Enterobacter cloacae TaxID=550 RepID=UPI003315ABD7
MAERWKIFLIIALIGLFAIPMAMACALMGVPRWALIAGHIGSIVTGFIVSEISRED